LNSAAPLSALFTSWLGVGWELSCQGAVGAKSTELVLDAPDVELELLAACAAASGSVPVPPKKDWYHPRSTLVLMLPATRYPPC
jgi:hypothetical protein